MSKTKPLNDIISAYDAGQRHFGENYIEEFCEKANTVKDTHPDIDWHFIGHIQSNKAKKLVQCLNLNMIETIDSKKIADTLNKECAKIEARKEIPPIDILIQVLAENTEGSKFGVSPPEAVQLVQHIKDSCPMLKFKGLMSMGEIGNTKEFNTVHELKLQILE